MGIGCGRGRLPTKRSQSIFRLNVRAKRTRFCLDSLLISLSRRMSPEANLAFRRSLRDPGGRERHRVVSFGHMIYPTLHPPHPTRLSFHDPVGVMPPYRTKTLSSLVRNTSYLSVLAVMPKCCVDVISHGIRVGRRRQHTIDTGFATGSERPWLATKYHLALPFDNTDSDYLWVPAVVWWAPGPVDGG